MSRFGLDQQIQDFALTIDGPPQVHALALDRDHHLVQVPGARRLWPYPAEVAGEAGSELQDPAPDRLIGSLDAALCQEFLDIAVAQREPEMGFGLRCGGIGSTF